MANRPLEPLLVSERDAARLLNVCEASIRNWRRERGLPSYKVAGRRLYDPNELLAWAKSQFTENKPAPAATGAEHKGGK